MWMPRLSWRSGDGSAPAAFDFRATFELEGNELTVRAMLAEEPADDEARYFVGS
jgi:hypothetical protein